MKNSSASARYLGLYKEEDGCFFVHKAAVKQEIATLKTFTANLNISIVKPGRDVTKTWQLYYLTNTQEQAKVTSIVRSNCLQKGNMGPRIFFATPQIPALLFFLQSHGLSSKWLECKRCPCWLVFWQQQFCLRLMLTELSCDHRPPLQYVDRSLSPLCVASLQLVNC